MILRRGDEDPNQTESAKLSGPSLPAYGIRAPFCVLNVKITVRQQHSLIIVQMG